jgi:hypothetical protein
MFRSKLVIAVCIAALLLSVNGATGSAHVGCDGSPSKKAWGTVRKTTIRYNSQGNPAWWAYEVRAWIMRTSHTVYPPNDGSATAPNFVLQALWATTDQGANSGGYWIEVGVTQDNGYPSDQDYRGFYWGRRAPGYPFRSWPLPQRSEDAAGIAHKYNIKWIASRDGYAVKINNEELDFANFNGVRISRMQTGAETNECQGNGGYNGIQYFPQFDWAWWESDPNNGHIVTPTDTSGSVQPGHAYNYYQAGGDYACSYINRSDSGGC